MNLYFRSPAHIEDAIRHGYPVYTNDEEETTVLKIWEIEDTEHGSLVHYKVKTTNGGLSASKSQMLEKVLQTWTYSANPYNDPYTTLIRLSSYCGCEDFEIRDSTSCKVLEITKSSWYRVESPGSYTIDGVVQSRSPWRRFPDQKQLEKWRVNMKPLHMFFTI